MGKRLNIYILDYANAMASAKHGIQDLFQIANYQAGRTLFYCHTISANTSAPNGSENILFIPPCLAAELPSFVDPDTLAMLSHWHSRGVVMVAACAGVFWLANAGLLNGKQATTHWLLLDKLAKDYPEIEAINRSDMVVDQGDIVTAAGLYAFQDLTLHLIARYANYALAKKVADYSLLDLKGRLQNYYQRFYPSYHHGDKLMIKAQQFCAKNVQTNVAISQVAEHCHLSLRTFLRRFKLATGFSPKQYLIQLRVEKAKQLMEMERFSVEEIAFQLGYSDTSNFIKIFKKVAGITPAEFQSRQYQRMGRSDGSLASLYSG